MLASAAVVVCGGTGTSGATDATGATGAAGTPAAALRPTQAKKQSARNAPTTRYATGAQTDVRSRETRVGDSSEQIARAVVAFGSGMPSTSQPRATAIPCIFGRISPTKMATTISLPAVSGRLANLDTHNRGDAPQERRDDNHNTVRHSGEKRLWYLNSTWATPVAGRKQTYQRLHQVPGEREERISFSWRWIGSSPFATVDLPRGLALACSGCDRECPADAQDHVGSGSRASPPARPRHSHRRLVVCSRVESPT
jgi:hypothetical protein